MNTKLKYLILSSLFIAMTAAFFSSCEEEKDLGTPRLFRPLSISIVSGTKDGQDLIFAFPKVKDAIGYEIKIADNKDFSGENIQIIDVEQATGNEVRVTIPITDASSIVWGRTDLYDFYITAKARNSDPVYDSKYLEPVVFSPYRENIFTNRKKLYGITETDTLTRESLYKDNVTFIWSEDNQTKIVVRTPSGELVKELDLTDEQKANKKAIVDGLSPLTDYVGFIFEGETSRGRVKFATTSPNEVIIDPSVEGTDLGAIIASAQADAVLRLKQGNYTISSTITIDKNLTIESFQEESSIVDASSKFELTGNLSYFALKYLKYKGVEADKVSLIDLANDFEYIGKIELEGCSFDKFKNIIYYGPANKEINTLVINNSIISNSTGGAHTIDLRNALLRNFRLTNSTLYNNVRDIVRVGGAAPAMQNVNVLISNNTFYNTGADGINHFIYFNSPHTGTYIITYNIFANCSSSTGSGMQFAGYTSLLYNNIYKFGVRVGYEEPKASDWKAKGWSENSNNNGSFDGKTDGVDPKFADPANGDFTLGSSSLKTMAPGKKPVGDPRWAVE